MVKDNFYSSEIRNKTRMPDFVTFIQLFIESSSQSRQEK